MTRVRVLATSALLLALTGCSSGTLVGNQPPRTSSPTTTSSTVPREHHVSRAKPDALVLLPRPCTQSDLRLRVGAPHLSAGTVRMVLRLLDVSRSACWVGGIARPRLLGPDGQLLSFHLQGHGSRVRSDHIVVRPGGSAWALLTQERCQGPVITRSASLRLLLVDQLFTVTAATTGDRAIPLCAATATLTAVGATVVSRTDSLPEGVAAVPAQHIALRMTDDTANGRLPTYGRTDLNGDGRPDLVVVHPRGRVVAVISGVGRRVVRLTDGAGRLRGFPLVGFADGAEQHVILAGEPSATGEEGAYQSPIIRWWHGRLGVVRRGDGQPLEVGADFGHGDVYDGSACSGGLTLSRYHLDDSRLNVRHVTIRGLRARVSAPVRSRLGREKGEAASAVDCAGLTTFGGPV